MSEQYVVTVTDSDGPWIYGPFDSAPLADEWIASQQNEEGTVGSNKAVVTILNLP